MGKYNYRMETWQGTRPKPKKRTQREYVLDRDKHICRLCFRAEDLGGYGHSLEVHHIIPKKQGGLDNIDNLITLCFHCHRRIVHKNKWEIITSGLLISQSSSVSTIQSSQVISH